MTDAAMERVSRLDRVTRLDLGGSQRLSDAGLLLLARMPQLQELDLSGWHSPITDRGLEVLRHLRELRRFTMCWPRRITDAGVANLAFCEQLESVDLLGTPTGDGAINALAGKFGLSLFWHTSAVTADGLKALAGLPNLGFLGCEGTICDDEAMRHIAAIPRLRMLMAQGTVASDDGFVALSRSQSLEYLWGRECPNLRGRGFAAMTAMPALRGLAVSCKDVDDTALSALPCFPALRELMPMDVPDAGFRHVGRCEQLEALWCMYCRDTGDTATEYIAGLSRLKTYYAGKTRITDRSLEILGRMQSLESIEFWETVGITNAGLAALAGLPRLRKLSIEGAPGITRDGLAVLPGSVQVNYS
jgi:hypothetical protein